MKNILIGIAAVILIVALFYFFRPPKVPVNTLPADYKNGTYEIENGYVQLKNGVAETGKADSATKTTTRYFGNEVTGDFYGNGREDVAFLLTQDAGGTGTFFYLVAALSDGMGGYQGTNGIFLGDRIAPQTTEFRNGQIIVNYADRKGGEPMTTPPSVGVSRYFKIVDGKLVEVTQEGQVQGETKG